MKVILYGRYGEYPQEIESLVKNAGLEIQLQRTDPERALASRGVDAVVTYGGDGAILGAERDFPGIPKLPLRDSHVCFHCSSLSNEDLLERLAASQLQSKEYLKIAASYQNKTLTSLNDIVVRNANPTSALRFSFSITPPPSPPPDPPTTLIGDGLVVSTPFGATGYFMSITKQPFTEGIGLAFNNIHNFEEKYRVLPEDFQITITIVRGPALLVSDNNPEVLNLPDGAETTIKKSPQVATLLTP